MYYIKFKLYRNLNQATSGIYDYNMDLFRNGELEKFFLLYGTSKISSRLQEQRNNLEISNICAPCYVYIPYVSVKNFQKKSDTLPKEILLGLFWD